MRVLLAIFSVLAPLHAGPQFWNDTVYNIAKTENVEWSVEGNFRFRPDFYDRRVGSEVEVDVARNVSTIGGYLFRYRDRDGFGYGVEQRVIGGVSVQPVSWVASTTLYERHIGRPDRPDFNRYRQQFEFEDDDAAVSPWIYQDFTFRREGFVRSRSRAGLRYKLSGFKVKMAYQFESVKSSSAWKPRHTIFVELTVDKPVIKRE